MSSELQSLVALAVVAIAALWLVRRTLAKKKHPGCGGDCGCPSQKITANLKH